MATLYTRTFNLKDSLSDEEVLEFWRHYMEEIVPAAQNIPGSRSVKAYSGAGALRADITFMWEMDDASVYERALASGAARRAGLRQGADRPLPRPPYAKPRSTRRRLVI